MRYHDFPNQVWTPITFEAGRAIFHDMILGPEAQMRVYEALSNLQSFSSYGIVIWFGFGARHIIDDLVATEQGIACVTVCAALRVSYHTFFAASVLQELSRRYAPPANLLPALHQWEARLY